jgi:hypothetical protein
MKKRKRVLQFHPSSLILSEFSPCLSVSVFNFFFHNDIWNDSFLVRFKVTLLIKKKQFITNYANRTNYTNVFIHICEIRFSSCHS